MAILKIQQLKDKVGAFSIFALQTSFLEMSLEKHPAPWYILLETANFHNSRMEWICA